MSSASVFRGVDFTGTDWADRNVDIAGRLGCDPALVAAARRHFGMVVDRRIDWSGVDFGRPAKEIAAEMGCSVVSVANAKRSLGLTRDRIPWDEADWTKSDAELADCFACAENTVRIARKRITGTTERRSRIAAAVADMVARGEITGEGSAVEWAARAEMKKAAAKAYTAERSKRTISVLFPQADFDALTEAAERTGTTKTDIIREAVAAWIVMHR